MEKNSSDFVRAQRLRALGIETPTNASDDMAENVENHPPAEATADEANAEPVAMIVQRMPETVLVPSSSNNISLTLNIFEGSDCTLLKEVLSKLVPGKSLPTLVGSRNGVKIREIPESEERPSFVDARKEPEWDARKKPEQDARKEPERDARKEPEQVARKEPERDAPKEPEQAMTNTDAGPSMDSIKPDFDVLDYCLLSSDPEDMTVTEWSKGKARQFTVPSRFSKGGRVDSPCNPMLNDFPESSDEELPRIDLFGKRHDSSGAGPSSEAGPSSAYGGSTSKADKSEKQATLDTDTTTTESSDDNSKSNKKKSKNEKMMATLAAFMKKHQKSKRKNKEVDSETSSDSEDEKPPRKLKKVRNEKKATTSEEDPNRGRCSICFDNTPNAILRCKHAYCSECCEKLKNKKKPCPKCGFKFRAWESLYL